MGAAVIAAAATMLIAACGGDDEPATSVAPEPADELTVAISGPVGADPLSADDRPSQFALHQVFEPLIATVEPPYGRAGSRKGPALGLRPAAGGTVWVIRLRRGVHFADGDLLNGSAVALNARRWVASGTGLIPGLITADAPRTDRVRLILSDPLPDLADRLADPRLGIVSPRAIRVRANGTVRFAARAAAGTGPFVIEERNDDGVSLVRNTGWWGSSYRLGPALRRIGFVVEPALAERLALLSAGQVEIADELGGGAASRAIANDPLLGEIATGTSLMGVERSLRGVDASDPGTPLSGAWLTAIDQSPAG